MSFDWEAFSKGIQGIKGQTGLLGGLQAGLGAYSGVRAGVDAKQKASDLLTKRAEANKLLSQGQFGKASSLISPVDSKLGETYGMKQAEYDKWLREQAGKTQRAQIMSPSGQSDEFQKVLDKTAASDIYKTMTTAPEDIRKSQSNIRAINDIQGTVKESPNIIGQLSGIKRFAGSVTGGLAGMSKDNLAKRAGVVQNLKQVQNSQIGRATEAGLSGINSIAEREAIIAGTKPDATAEEIIAATNIMKKNEELIQEALRRKGKLAYKNYQSFRGSGDISVPDLNPKKEKSNLKEKYGLK